MANTISEERLRAVLFNSDLIDADDDGFPGLLRAANADPDEGPEWLPYYKIALALLIQALGAAEAIAYSAIKDPNPAKNKDRLLLLKKVAHAIGELSNHVCAVGPGEAPEGLLPVAKFPWFEETQ